ncbi:methionine aminopeptidase [Catenulispora sp. GP43]
MTVADRPFREGSCGERSCFCTSVNDAIVHGIPGGYRLRDGDLVGVDCGATPDGWTLLTTDGSRAAHVEHTIAVTDDGPRVLTRP